MGFSDIKGQERVGNMLKRALEINRLAHSYLFVGPPGVGRKKIALTLAKAVNCLKYKNDTCEECNACKRIDSFNHPDVRLIAPEGNYLKIEQIRNLQREISFKLFEGRKKVYIITEVDKITPEAANCLLKVLEEPPGESLLILITANLTKLFPTIISRCQLVRFNPLPLGEIELTEAQEEILNLLSIIYTNDLEQLFKISDELAIHKEKIGETLNFLLNWYRDLLMTKVTGIKKLLNFPQKESELKEKVNKFSSFQLEEAINCILECAQFIQKNVNPRLVLEVMFLKLREGINDDGSSRNKV